jgi:hypothetical protein
MRNVERQACSVFFSYVEQMPVFIFLGEWPAKRKVLYVKTSTNQQLFILGLEAWCFFRKFYRVLILKSQKTGLSDLKGLSHEIFQACFLACMDAAMSECEPLMLLKLL